MPAEVSDSRKGIRLKGLDGIRALCALFILWGHMAQKDFADWGLGTFPLPECCAYVFFVISGFLAGFRIDTISSPISYYKKKAKRILPLYYSYMLVVVLVFLMLGRGSEVLNTNLLYYLFLVPSIPFARTNGVLPLVHLWFIGTLLLFYLVFPLFAKVKKEKRAIYAIVISFIWLVIKLLLKINGGGYYYRLVSVTSLDILFLGVWGGLMMRNGSTLFGRKIVLLGVVAWVLFLLSGVYGRYIPAPIRAEYVSFLALIMIVSSQNSASFSLLENKVTRFLGGISYEIYVCHILIVILLSNLYCQIEGEMGKWILFTVVTLVVILCAYAVKYLLRRLFYQSRYIVYRDDSFLR